MASLYLPTVAACAEALTALAADARRLPAQRIEVPREQYDALVRSLRDASAAPGRNADAVDAFRGGLCRGTLTYAQAWTLARSARVVGVGVEPGTGRITTDCACGLGFAAGYARACWAGAGGDKAIAQALAWQLEADSSVGTLIAERLHGGAGRTAAIGHAASGIAQSPVGRSTVNAALGTLKSLSGSTRTALVGAPMRANPVVSTLTAVVNLDLYRAALARSISWQQFTKNLVVKTSGAVTATGGWLTGAAAGAVVGGPLGALIGGLLGAAGGGTAGSIAAKRVADRLLPDDAERMLAIVREASEQSAWEHLLVDAEVDVLAARLGERVTPAWLRKLYRTGWAEGGDTWHEAPVRAFAERELRQLCQGIVARRTTIAPPSPARVEAVLRRIEAAADSTAAAAMRDGSPS